MGTIEELDLLNSDIDDIYLGNLGTVDADLNLPNTGKRGSAFAWRGSGCSSRTPAR